MPADNRNEDVDAIERDVERTQDALGDTVQQLEDKLSPRKFAQSLFSDDNADFARDAWFRMGFVNPPADRRVDGVWLTVDLKGPGRDRAVFERLLG